MKFNRAGLNLLTGLTTEQAAALLSAEGVIYRLKPLTKGDTNTDGLTYGGKKYPAVGRVVKITPDSGGAVVLHYTPFAADTAVLAED